MRWSRSSGVGPRDRPDEQLGYALAAGGAQALHGPVEVYDLAEDLGQQKDVAAEEAATPELKKMLSQRYRELQEGAIDWQAEGR